MQQRARPSIQHIDHGGKTDYRGVQSRASTKRVWPIPNPDGTHRIDRCENVKDVGQYITRIDEMIERKQRLFEEK